MSYQKNRAHVCAALIGNIHTPRNVSRPPINDDGQLEPKETEILSARRLLDQAENRSGDQINRVSILTEGRNGSQNSLSDEPRPSTSKDDSVHSSLPDALNVTSSTLSLPFNEDDPKRRKRNSICVGATDLNQLSVIKRRGVSFLHINIPDSLSGRSGSQSAAPNFHIPKFTITAPAESTSRKLSNALHAGLGAFALRRHSNTVSRHRW